MGEINNALGASGAGHVLRHGEETYTVLPPTQGCFAEFERWLEDRARGKLESRRRQLGPEQYEEERRELRQDINSLVYSWGRRCCNEALRSQEGQCEFAAILLRQSHPKMTAAKVLEIAKANPDQYRDVMSAAISEAEDSDPNPKAAVQAQGV